MRTHIFFPNLEVKETNHLSDQEMGAWVTHVLIPSIAEVYPWSARQHHPQSWGDVLSKANRKEQIYLNSREQGSIDYRQALYNGNGELEALWRAIYRRCNTRVGRIEALVRKGDSWHLPEFPFRNPLLLVIGHDLKLLRCSENLTGIADVSRALFKDSFHFDEETFPSGDRWVDWAEEVTPKSDNFILIRKRGCLKAWTQRFEDPIQTIHNTKLTYYNWAATRDGAALTIEFTLRHTLRRHLAYIKSYNTVKECFDSPLKVYGPFSNHFFRFIGMAEELIAEWLKSNQPGVAVPQNLIRRIRQCLEATKEQCRNGIPKIFSAGTRLELRSTGECVEIMDMQQQRRSAIQAPMGDEHFNFFIFRYEDVEAFYKASINRWLVLLESIANTPMTAEPCGAPGFLNYEHQLSYRTMTAAVLHALQLFFDGDTNKHHKIWRGAWRGRKRNTEHEGTERQREGLNVKLAVEMTGVAYFPDGEIKWDVHPPRFYRKKAVGPALNDFSELGKRYRRRGGATRAVSVNAAVIMLLRAQITGKDVKLATDAGTILETAAELCVRAYTVEVLGTLRSYWLRNRIKQFKDSWPTDRPGPSYEDISQERRKLVNQWEFNASCGGQFASRDVLGGYWGLCPRIIGFLTEGNANLGSVDDYGLNISANRMSKQWNDVERPELWQHRAIQPFLSNRAGSRPNKFPKRTWYGKKFCELTNRISIILRICGGDRMANLFENKALPRAASQYILAMPAFEEKKFVRLRKGGGLQAEFWAPTLEQHEEDFEKQSYSLRESFTMFTESLQRELPRPYEGATEPCSDQTYIDCLARDYYTALGKSTIQRLSSKEWKSDCATLYTPGWFKSSTQLGKMTSALDFMSRLSEIQQDPSISL